MYVYAFALLALTYTHTHAHSCRWKIKKQERRECDLNRLASGTYLVSFYVANSKWWSVSILAPRTITQSSRTFRRSHHTETFDPPSPTATICILYFVWHCLLAPFRSVPFSAAAFPCTFPPADPADVAVALELSLQSLRPVDSRSTRGDLRDSNGAGAGVVAAAAARYREIGTPRT